MADYSIEVSVPNVGPQGEVGPVGPPNELTLGTVTTGDAGTEAAATISGTPPNQTLDLTIPRGDTGLQGTTGNAGPTGAGGLGVVPAEIYGTMQAAVEGGITFGGVYRHTSGSVFWVEEPDPDAAAFIASSGATDVWNIQKFVQGVKDLGLWDNMVCWPLRSSQNAGTGATAYSLGGLGTFNGTLVNGPTWGVDGITFDGVDDAIEIGDATELRAGDVDFALVASARHAAINRNAGLISKELASGGSGQREYVMQQHNSNRHRLAIRPAATGDVIATDGTAISAGVNYFIAMWHDATADTLNTQTNDNTPATLAHSTGVFASNNPLTLGRQGSFSFYQGVMAFAAFIRVALNSDQREFFRTSPLLLP